MQKVSVFHNTPLLNFHFGVKETNHAFPFTYYSPSLHQAVLQFVRACLVCQKIKALSGHIIREELGCFPVPQRPFKGLLTDIAGPLP